jgi:hypothetical protein
MDPEAMKYLAPLGVGGILAGMIFMVYRKDALRWIEDWKGQSQMLLKVVVDTTAAMTALVSKLEVLVQMAAGVTALIAKLEERENLLVKLEERDKRERP